MGLEKDRADIKQLQDLVLHMANLIASLEERVKVLEAADYDRSSST